jgi:hypothetical protein
MQIVPVILQDSCPFSFRASLHAQSSLTASDQNFGIWRDHELCLDR